MDTESVIFVYNLHFLWKKKLQAETIYIVVTVGRNRNCINNLSKYAYHKVPKGIKIFK